MSASSTYVSDFVQQFQSAYGSVGVNFYPILTVPADQPPATVEVSPSCNSFLADTGTAIPIPPNAPSENTSDDPLIIDQPATHTEWELWRAVHNPDGTWSACWGGKLDTTTSSGVFPHPYGLAASGISYLATAITEADVASGSINHAIAIQMPRCTSPAVFPANRTDCPGDPGQAPYGTYFRFPTAMPVPAGLTPLGDMVFRAVQRYGMVLTDHAGAVMTVAEDPRDWVVEGHSGPDPMTGALAGQPEYKVISDLPWSSLEAVAAP